MALTVVCAYLGHEPWVGAGKRDADPLLCPRWWNENGADDPAVVMTKGPREDWPRREGGSVLCRRCWAERP